MPDVAPSEQLRLFIAVSVPEEVKANVERAQEEIRHDLNSKNVRWTRSDQFHLTLKFLGSVESSRVGDLVAALSNACKRFSPLQLRAEKVGCFPHLLAPRILWVGISDENDQLLPLQNAIEAATLSFTTEQRHEKFTGHITLARIQAMHRSNAEILRPLVERYSTRVLGAWTAHQLELFRSELSPQGAKHSVIATSPLTQTI